MSPFEGSQIQNAIYLTGEPRGQLTADEQQRVAGDARPGPGPLHRRRRAVRGNDRPNREAFERRQLVGGTNVRDLGRSFVTPA